MKRLSADTAMTYYEIARASEVIIDRRPLGLGGEGAILAQKKSEEERSNVVTYVRPALTLVESNIKVRWNGKHLYLNGYVIVSSYVIGAKFKIVTDHEPL